MISKNNYNDILLLKKKCDDWLYYPTVPPTPMCNTVYSKVAVVTFTTYFPAQLSFPSSTHFKACART